MTDRLLTTDPVTEIRVAINEIFDRPHARVYRNATQSIPDATPTALSFTHERYDNGGLWDPAQPTRLTANRDGLWLPWANALWLTAGGAVRSLLLRVNGTTQVAQVMVPPTTGNTSQQISTPIRLDAGQYVEVLALHDAGAARNVDFSTATDQNRCEAVLMFLGPWT